MNTHRRSIRVGMACPLAATALAPSRPVSAAAADPNGGWGGLGQAGYHYAYLVQMDDERIVHMDENGLRYLDESISLPISAPLTYARARVSFMATQGDRLCGDLELLYPSTPTSQPIYGCMNGCPTFHGRPYEPDQARPTQKRATSPRIASGTHLLRQDAVQPQMRAGWPPPAPFPHVRRKGMCQVPRR